MATYRNWSTAPDSIYTLYLKTENTVYSDVSVRNHMYYYDYDPKVQYIQSIVKRLSSNSANVPLHILYKMANSIYCLNTK